MRKFWKALAVLSVLGFLWGGVSCSHSSSSDSSDSSPSENETEATVSAVTVSGSSAVAVGAVIQLTAAVTMSDESAYDGTVTWKSSDSAVATVDASGILTGVAEGNVAITASAGGVTSSAFAVTVSETVQTAISSVSISGSSSIQYNGSSELTATPVYSGSPDIVYTWSITEGSDYAALSATSGQTVTLTANNTSDSEQTVTLTVTASDSSDASLTATSPAYSITVSAQGVTVANEVKSVTASASSSAVAADGSTVLSAAAESTGSPSITYTWEIIAGSDYAALSATEGQSVTLTGTNTTSSGQTVTVQVRASDGSNSVTDSLDLTVAGLAAQEEDDGDDVSGGSEVITPDEGTDSSTLTLTYVGSDDTPRFEDGVVTNLKNGGYLVYPLDILDEDVTSAQLTATVSWTAANNQAGLGFITMKDGLYAGEELSHYFIGGQAGIKGASGSSWSDTVATGTEYTMTVTYDSTAASPYAFVLTASDGSKITKSFKETQTSWADCPTEQVYLAVGGSSSNITVSNVVVTVNGSEKGTAGLVSSMAEDSRTALSASGSVSYTLTSASSNKGDTAVITLSEVAFDGLSVSPSAAGSWSWDEDTVSYNGSTDPTTAATFIPSDRTAYKAILSQEITIAVTDSREAAAAGIQAFTINYFDTSDGDLTTYALAAAGTTTGSDYVTLTAAESSYNSIYDTLNTSWSSSTGATFALTNAAGSYSATASGADLLTVSYKITAKDYDVTLKTIDFAGSQTATGNVHIDLRYNGSSVYTTDNGKTYSVSAQELNQTIAAGSSATITLAFALKDSATLSKAISPILKDLVIYCSVETEAVVLPNTTATAAALSDDITLTVSGNTLTVTLPSGAENASYAWAVNGKTVSGAAGSSYSLTDYAGAADGLTYAVTAKVTVNGVVFTKTISLSYTGTN